MAELIDEQNQLDPRANNRPPRTKRFNSKQSNGKPNGKPPDNFIPISEVHSFIDENVSRNYSCSIKIQLKQGQAKPWAKVTRYIRMGGDTRK